MISLKDLVHKGYNIVSVDGKDVSISSPRVEALEHSNLEDEKSIIIPPRRFDSFLSQYEKYCSSNPHHVFGSVEPLELKSNRPFLLSNEVAVSKVSPQMKMVKGKGKGKGKGNRKAKGGEVFKGYTFSNPPPSPMNFISSNRPYRLTQTIAEAPLFTSSTTLNTFSGTSFIISQIDQYSSFSNVFDQYRIDEIEVWIEPNSSTVANGYLYSCVDYDDANVLTTIGQCADYTNCLATPASECHYRRFIPHIAVAAYSGSFTSYMNAGPQWIDFASTSVQHFGLKTACTMMSTAQAFNFRARFHFSMRNVR
jgi:hypothetical protein